MKLLLAVIILIIVYVCSWYQLYGQFVNDTFKKYQYALILLSVPNTYACVYAAKLITEYFKGRVWPNRILTFSVGLIMFTILSFVHFDEKLTAKTITLIVLAAVIVILQILWK